MNTNMWLDYAILASNKGFGRFVCGVLIYMATSVRVGYVWRVWDKKNQQNNVQAPYAMDFIDNK